MSSVGNYFARRSRRSEFVGQRTQLAQDSAHTLMHNIATDPEFDSIVAEIRSGLSGAELEEFDKLVKELKEAAQEDVTANDRAMAFMHRWAEYGWLDPRWLTEVRYNLWGSHTTANLARSALASLVVGGAGAAIQTASLYILQAIYKNRTDEIPQRLIDQALGINRETPSTEPTDPQTLDLDQMETDATQLLDETLQSSTPPITPETSTLTEEWENMSDDDRTVIATVASLDEETMTDLAATFAMWDDLTPEQQQAVISSLAVPGNTYVDERTVSLLANYLVEFFVGTIRGVALSWADSKTEVQNRADKLKKAIEGVKADAKSNLTQGWEAFKKSIVNQVKGGTLSVIVSLAAIAIGDSPAKVLAETPKTIGFAALSGLVNAIVDGIRSSSAWARGLSAEGSLKFKAYLKVVVRTAIQYLKEVVSIGFNSQRSWNEMATLALQMKVLLAGLISGGYKEFNNYVTQRLTQGNLPDTEQAGQTLAKGLKLFWKFRDHPAVQGNDQMNAFLDRFAQPMNDNVNAEDNEQFRQDFDAFQQRIRDYQPADNDNQAGDTETQFEGTINAFNNGTQVVPGAVPELGPNDSVEVEGAVGDAFYVEFGQLMYRQNENYADLPSATIVLVITRRDTPDGPAREERRTVTINVAQQAPQQRRRANDQQP